MSRYEPDKILDLLDDLKNFDELHELAKKHTFLEPYLETAKAETIRALNALKPNQLELL